MAKEISAADVAAFLAAKGLTIPEDLTSAIENEKEDAAYHVIAATISEDAPVLDNETETDYATDMQVRLFTLAQDLYDNHKHEVRNVGQGQKDQTMFTVETHAGTLFVRLSRS